MCHYLVIGFISRLTLDIADIILFLLMMIGGSWRLYIYIKNGTSDSVGSTVLLKSKINNVEEDIIDIKNDIKEIKKDKVSEKIVNIRFREIAKTIENAASQFMMAQEEVRASAEMNAKHVEDVTKSSQELITQLKQFYEFRLVSLENRMSEIEK